MKDPLCKVALVRMLKVSIFEQLSTDFFKRRLHYENKDTFLSHFIFLSGIIGLQGPATETMDGRTVDVE